MYYCSSNDYDKDDDLNLGKVWKLVCMINEFVIRFLIVLTYKLPNIITRFS